MDIETTRTYETMEREESEETEEFYKEDNPTMTEIKPILTRKEKWAEYMRKYRQEQNQNNTMRIFKVMTMLEDLKKELTREIKKDTASILARIEKSEASNEAHKEKKEERTVEAVTPPMFKIFLKIDGEVTAWDIEEIQMLNQEIINAKIEKNYTLSPTERARYNKCNSHGKIILLLTR
jgi:hypothetical protein